MVDVGAGQVVVVEGGDSEEEGAIEGVTREEGREGGAGERAEREEDRGAWGGWRVQEIERFGKLGDSLIFEAHDFFQVFLIIYGRHYDILYDMYHLHLLKDLFGLNPLDLNHRALLPEHLA